MWYTDFFSSFHYLTGFSRHMCNPAKLISRDGENVNIFSVGEIKRSRPFQFKLLFWRK